MQKIKVTIKEIKRCASDIVYFANNYCTVMTDKGLQTISLRPYQEEMLRQFQKERNKKKYTRKTKHKNYGEEKNNE